MLLLALVLAFLIAGIEGSYLGMTEMIFVIDTTLCNTGSEGRHYIIDLIKTKRMPNRKRLTNNILFNSFNTNKDN